MSTTSVTLSTALAMHDGEYPTYTGGTYVYAPDSTHDLTLTETDW